MYYQSDYGLIATGIWEKSEFYCKKKYWKVLEAIDYIKKYCKEKLVLFSEFGKHFDCCIHLANNNDDDDEDDDKCSWNELH